MSHLATIPAPRRALRTATLAFVALGLALPLTACGGSSGDSGPSAPQTVTLLATPMLDGYAVSGGGTNNNNGHIVGDLDSLGTGRDYRGFFSFDISVLPAGAQIQTATLRISQRGVTGTPYADGHGQIVVDHMDYGPTLDSADFGATAIQLAFATMFSDATLGYGAVNATTRLQTDLANGSPRSQYRLRFSNFDSNADGGNDYSEIEDAENSRSSGEVPQLVITYVIP